MCTGMQDAVQSQTEISENQAQVKKKSVFAWSTQSFSLSTLLRGRCKMGCNAPRCLGLWVPSPNSRKVFGPAKNSVQICFPSIVGDCRHVQSDYILRFVESFKNF